MGNHDNMKDIVKLDRWESIHEYGTEIWVKDDDNKKARGANGYQQIVMSHYPILSWNRAHHGSWMIHGHAHQSLTMDKSYDWYYKKKVMDVGCNGINYTPISYQEVKKIMDKKEVSLHH
jgi:calcineurin-like phosphoesterase family protein